VTFVSGVRRETNRKRTCGAPPAHARLGHAQEAQDWLTKAQDAIDRLSAAQPADAVRLTWFQTLELWVLRREAEDLVKKAKP
jgi:hypothetical protein